MNRFAIPTTAAFAALLGLLGGCGDFARTAGGTSDTDNAFTVAGAVETGSGGPAAGKQALLRREDYLSPYRALSKYARDQHDTLTDAAGRFRIDSVDTGRYFIEAREGDSLSTLFTAEAEGKPRLLSLPARPLAKSAVVSGIVLFRAGTLRVFVQCYGLERCVPIDSVTGSFSIPLPAGSFRLRFSDPQRPSGARIIPVTVTAGQSLILDTLALGDTTLPFAAWRHSAELGVNTSVSGAATKTAQYGFPLLVRLDAGFGFSQARPDGADVRFTKSDGRTPLPFEIERWDAAGGKAEIWVRMDTVLADVRRQAIHMYWGKTDAIPAASGAVFAPADGWRGVWHLGESPSNAAGTYGDATGNGNAGAGVALGDSSTGEGAIGRALRLNGKNQWARVPDATTLRLGKGDFLISGWFRADTLKGTYQVLSKRDSGANYELQLDSTASVVAFPGDPAKGPLGLVGPSTVSLRAWHHVALVREGKRHDLYLDGVLDTSNTATAADTDGPTDLFFGKDGFDQKEYWNGMLDEMVVAGKARGPDWIRLTHRTQAPGSKTIEWHRYP